jgi:hypothetical protein
MQLRRAEKMTDHPTRNGIRERIGETAARSGIEIGEILGQRGEAPGSRCSVSHRTST